MQPLVSISCITYNHAKYIRECLDGFLMQECDFEFEILIYDDASTDGTQEIIKEYFKKYPDIIKPIFQTENQYSKGIRGMMARFNFPRAKGRYIALCEGDDYWTDSLKLQKQVDFLEQNHEFSLVYHRTKSYNQKLRIFKDDGRSNGVTKSTIKDLAYYGNFLFDATAACMFKNIIDLSNYNITGVVGDYLLWFRCAEKGKIGFIPEFMSVYRVNENSVYRPLPQFKRTIYDLTAIKDLNEYTNSNKLKILLEKQSLNKVVSCFINNSLSIQEKNEVMEVLNSIKKVSKFRFTTKIFVEKSKKKLKEILKN